jgi:c(7)-type cytochrome triheme protein
MKLFVATLVATIALFSLNAVLAVPPGMEVQFTKSPMGKVTFSGKIHAEKGLLCPDCHPKVFEQKKGTAKITLADHEPGKKFCFTCHNGTKSFVPKDNCARCHKL